MRPTLPRARADELVIEELDDELLVYDLRTDAAHCLDAEAAVIWRACDGTASVGDIAATAGTTPEAVEHALEELSARDLVVGVADHSRREAVKLVLTAGAVGAALPIVKSIVAPAAAQAGATSSCLPNGAGCAVDSQCCSFFCNTSTPGGGVCFGPEP